MMMENVNYGREELIYLNMVRQGVLGELLHGEAAYIHPLREQMENGDSTGSWRTFQYAKRNGNLYPTHGLGPVAQYMNLGPHRRQLRPDRFLLLPCQGPPPLRAEVHQAHQSEVQEPRFQGRRPQHLHHQDHARPHHHGAVG
ncbi:MAG: hypothetical protein QM755_06225 [Luteolibacter sp.]